eukprot:TRINITY_DN29968_c0_g1_i3.p1 TRINITY_DN29968_c0_g1~~TRINITY_DN29968_c0_g1_i3.p1  ORF type:complete len:366 (-),score=79.68 TRINITY_DN29968_c0_g1_i3:46-1143(-)
MQDLGTGSDACEDFSQKMESILQDRQKLVKRLEKGETPEAIAKDFVPNAAFSSVDRREKLTAKEYFEEYMSKGRPVIITDYSANVLAGEGDWNWVESLCGDMNVTLVRRSKQAKYQWSGLFRESSAQLSKWMSAVKAGEADPELYLMDHGLAGRCDAMMKSVSIPKFFTNDLWKRLPFDRDGTADMYNSHPSLFVGGAGSGGALHVDSHASTFWQLLLEGRKRWTLFALPDYQRRVLLYSGVEHEILHTYPVPPEKPDFEKFPLLAVAEQFKVVAEVGPGELMIVPYDVPHMVENIDNVMALSMNVLEHEAVPRLIEDLTARTCFSSDETLVANLDLLKGQLPPRELDPVDLPFDEFRSYAPLKA